MNPQPDASAASLVLNYVPNEVCLVVEISQATAPRPGLAPVELHRDGEEAANALYALVSRSLNQTLSRLLERKPVEFPTSFQQDLMPTALLRQLSPNARQQVLQPLHSPQGRLAKSRVRPWVHLVASTSLPAAPRRALQFYQVGATLPDASAASLDLYAQGVRELVNLINQNLGRINRDLQQAAGTTTVRVLAATPNWLTAGSAHSCGGPGARPEPVPDKDNRTFVFLPDGMRQPSPQQEALAALVEAQRAQARERGGPGDVIVAVLDTRPPRDQVLKAAEERYPDNRLLRDVAKQVQYDDLPGMDPSYFQFLEGHLPNWQGPQDQPGPDRAHFKMADHGLFVAGIIRDIAPGAEVHLLQVLNDFGVGDLLLLTWTLSQLPGRFLADPNRPNARLVVNLSLMADIPVGERLVSRWLPKTAEDPAALRQHQADICVLLNAAHLCLASTLTWLNDLGVLVVAAAGNDAFPGSTRPEPRYPARYDWVLGVGAVQVGDGRRPADFSNRGDEIVMGNGIAVFGGNADLPPRSPGDPPSPRVIDLNQRPVDAVVGVFSAPELPLGAGKNTTGWAYWAGTSFATPVVSAIAADLWLSQPPNARSGPAEIITAIRSFSVDVGDPADPDGPLDCPVIFARQASAP